MHRRKVWALGAGLVLALGCVVATAWGAGDDKSKPTVEKAAAPVNNARAQEEANLLRRMAVCDKLRRIALDTNDAELQRLADQLDERSYSVYMQRTAKLPSVSAAFDSDVGVLEKQLPFSGKKKTAKPEDLP